MKITIWIIIIVIMFLGPTFVLTVCGNTPSEEKIMDYGISLSTNKGMYCVGEPIIIKLNIFNHTDKDIIFHFNSSQRYDFIVKDEKGKEVWRWSEDKMFTMVLAEETLGPTNSEIIYSEKCSEKLIPGYYKIIGVLISTNKQISRNMSGSIVIEVK